MEIEGKPLRKNFHITEMKRRYRCPTCDGTKLKIDSFINYVHKKSYQQIYQKWNLNPIKTSRTERYIWRLANQSGHFKGFLTIPPLIGPFSVLKSQNLIKSLKCPYIESNITVNYNINESKMGILNFVIILGFFNLTPIWSPSTLIRLKLRVKLGPILFLSLIWSYETLKSLLILYSISQ